MAHPASKSFGLYSHSPFHKAFLILGFALGLAARAHALDFGGANDITAVSSKTNSDYVRARQADGSFVPESYAFGKGGVWAGAGQDGSIDKLNFLDIAHMIANPLASQNYFPSTDARATKLLIMVYWGTTHVPQRANESVGYANLQAANAALSTVTAQAVGMPKSSAAAATSAADGALTTAMAMVSAENRMREQDDLVNLKMLGYDSWLQKTEGDHRGTAFEQTRQDLYDEIEESRYFVVLMAYDFNLLWKDKKHKLLWETRFSIRQSHHEFDKELPSLAQYASRYFGQDSHGLVHDALPPGHVDIGDVKSLGEVPPK
jgi:hypothetical protein